jgi:hypothetical protein
MNFVDYVGVFSVVNFIVLVFTFVSCRFYNDSLSMYKQKAQESEDTNTKAFLYWSQF